MNIFYLHPEPRVAAAMLHDKHVVKMCLETVQILCSVYARYGQEAPYRPTHPNHPCVRWAGDSVWHYQWLVQHAHGLFDEYTHRYGRTHASKAVLSAVERSPVGMHATGWHQPAQAMPPEFQVPGDPVAAYRNYYLARKVVQSKWTRRDVPSFIGESKMAKAAPKTAPTKAAPKAEAPKAEAPKAEAIPRTRGPRGTTEDAVITLKVSANPKREGSKAHTVFSHYQDGMTIKEFADALEKEGLGKEATPNLVYDSKHGFIEIAGYEPPGGVLAPKEPKPKAEPKAKKAKAKAGETAEADANAEEEVVD